jgi:hypothetical protein
MQSPEWGIAGQVRVCAGGCEASAAGKRGRETQCAHNHRFSNGSLGPARHGIFGPRRCLFDAPGPRAWRAVPDENVCGSHNGKSRAGVSAGSCRSVPTAKSPARRPAVLCATAEQVETVLTVDTCRSLSNVGCWRLLQHAASPRPARCLAVLGRLPTSMAGCALQFRIERRWPK